MKFSLITKKFGTQTIDTEQFDARTVSKGSTVYKAVEYLFNEWYDFYSEIDRDIKCCYEGWNEDEPAIYSKVGAIVQAIEALIEIVEETKMKVVTSKDLVNMDLEACFQL